MQVALLSPFVQREVLRSGHGVSEDDPVVLPKQVCAAAQLCCTCQCLAFADVELRDDVVSSLVMYR
jgi:hypothetical protein